MAHIEVTAVETEAVQRYVMARDKFTSDDLMALFRSEDTRPMFEMLRDVVYQWLTDYKGDFSYLVDMKTAYLMRGQLTMKQAAGVVNCFRAEANRNKVVSTTTETGTIVCDKPAATPALAVTAQTSIMEGIYTIGTDADGSNHVTIRVTPHWNEEQAAKGTQVAKFLSGSDNESSYTGFANIDGTRITVWSKHRGNTRAINALTALMAGSAEDRAAMGYLYAQQSGNCYRCNRTLTVPASQTRGLGPVCYEKVYG